MVDIVRVVQLFQPFRWLDGRFLGIACKCIQTNKFAQPYAKPIALNEARRLHSCQPAACAFTTAVALR